MLRVLCATGAFLLAGFAFFPLALKAQPLSSGEVSDIPFWTVVYPIGCCGQGHTGPMRIKQYTNQSCIDCHGEPVPIPFKLILNQQQQQQQKLVASEGRWALPWDVDTQGESPCERM